MLSSWIGWSIIAFLLATTYVQVVGKQIELKSGADRLKHPALYRHLFGGPPWIQWLMYRWSGFIQIGGVALTVWLYGWKSGLFLFIGFVCFGLLMMRTAGSHAAQMIADLQKQHTDEEQ